MTVRRLAVGGIHVFEKSTPCQLTQMRPEGIARDLHWAGALAIEVDKEGAGEIRCGRKKIEVVFASPTRLEIELTEPRQPVAKERFHTRARVYDQAGELEIGKFTLLEWSASGPVEPAPDPSAGEFGQCDTCFGMYTFKANEPGKAKLEAKFGRISATLAVTVS